MVYELHKFNYFSDKIKFMTLFSGVVCEGRWERTWWYLTTRPPYARSCICDLLNAIIRLKYRCFRKNILIIWMPYIITKAMLGL